MQESRHQSRPVIAAGMLRLGVPAGACLLVMYLQVLLRYRYKCHCRVVYVCPVPHNYSAVWIHHMHAYSVGCWQLAHGGRRCVHGGHSALPAPCTGHTAQLWTTTHCFRASRRLMGPLGGCVLDRTILEHSAASHPSSARSSHIAPIRLRANNAYRAARFHCNRC